MRKLLDTADEPVVLVGHSHGGMVITELADHPMVRHSVYLAAIWPQRGQSAIGLVGDVPAWAVPRNDGAMSSVRACSGCPRSARWSPTKRAD